MLKLVIKENLNKIIVYRGTDKDIPVSSFDLTKTIEFGFHFGSKESAEHRGHSKSNNFYLKKYELSIKNPLRLDDLMRWDLENVLSELTRKKIIDKKFKDDKISSAVSLAKQSGLNLRVQKNLILSEVLSNLGYDCIVYENKGESGGSAYIVWDKNKIKEIT